MPAIINEFSQGASGYKEWFEILVVQSNLDLRGWSAGDLDNGTFHPLIEFPQIPFWASLPAGTLIVIYNGGDPDPPVLAAGAPMTNGANGMLLIDATDTNLLQEVGAWPNNGQFGNTNPDDLPVLRDAAGQVVHDVAGAHPTALIPTAAGNQVLQYLRGPDDDLFETSSWQRTTSSSASPGAPNSAANAQWINALRAGALSVPPLLYSPGDHAVRETRTLAFTVLADPTDGDPITLTASNLPPGAQFEALEATGYFYWPDAGPLDAAFTTRFYAVDKDGVAVVTSHILVVENPVEGSFRTNWLWMEEGPATSTGWLEVVLNQPGDALFALDLSGTAAVGFDVAVVPTSITFNAAGPTSQWIRIEVMPDHEPEGPEWLEIELIPMGLAGTASPARAHIRIRDDDALLAAAANLSSQIGACTPQYGEANRRLLRGLSPDVIAIQEFKMSGTNAMSDFVETLFGPGWSVFAEPTNSVCALPNGIISRWPILSAGVWNDVELSDRNFVWATIDLPGDRNLHVVSVHFKAGDTPADRDRRANQARQVTNYVALAGWPSNDFVMLAGDLNQATRNESALSILTILFSDDRVPTDQLGDPDTNLPRNRPYDYVLPNAALEAAHIPVVFGDLIFSNGMVFDSRLWAPPPNPIRAQDSEAVGIQHLAVLKLFALPQAAPGADEDEDGLPDEWERQFFAELGVLGRDTDYDGDGASDGAEYRAGTNPVDAASVFRLVGLVQTENSQLEIRWPGATNRFYRVWRADDLLAGFVCIASNLPGSPSSNQWVDELAPGAAVRFYWVEVE